MFNKKIYISLTLFTLVIFSMIKIGIDNQLNYSVEKDKKEDYIDKMDLIFKKTNNLKIEKDKDLSFFIDSLKSDNKILLELIELNKKHKNDYKISIKEYNEFNELFEKLYN